MQELREQGPIRTQEMLTEVFDYKVNGAWNVVGNRRELGE